MNIWLIHLGELLPVDKGFRPFRYTYLAEALSERGHHVIRWAPTFVHATKQYRASRNAIVEINEFYKIILLHGSGYRKHVGIQRIFFHYQMAYAFLKLAQKLSSPDIIVVGMPTPEMVWSAVRYGEKHHVPVVIDIRDIWPDVFYDMLPEPVRKIGALLTLPMRKMNSYSFRRATAIVGISDSYLDWGIKYANRKRSKHDRVFHMGYRRLSLDDSTLLTLKRTWVKRGVRPDSFLCVFFGTIGHQFDLETVIQAARYLQDMKEDVQFIICGDGERLAHYKALANDVHNVLFPGWVSSEEIAALVKMAKVGLAPYRSKAKMSLPNKPFEYMAGGLPILSSLKGDLEIILQEFNCGITYEPGDVNGFVRSLLLLKKNDATYSAMRQNAESLFEKHFSADIIYPAFVDYLESIIEESK